MNNIIKKQKVRLFLLLLLFANAFPVMAQNAELSGKVLEVPIDTTWILALVGVLLGLYKIYKYNYVLREH
ncbi:MAG: hypothetical protein PSV16_02900 [Flavobacterium sp.]|nr:hypothetical protein [Flavobacterium sp.]